MIKYNLHIDDNLLIINLEVEDKPYYENVVIKGVKVYTSLQYSADTDPKEHYAYQITKNPSKTFSMEVDITGNNSDLFIIEPQIDGILLADIPCGKGTVNNGVIYNDRLLFSKGMNYLKELSDNCDIPKSLIDFILLKYAMDMSAKMCDYDKVIKYWGRLTGKTLNSFINKCGCR